MHWKALPSDLMRVFGRLVLFLQKLNRVAHLTTETATSEPQQTQ